MKLEKLEEIKHTPFNEKEIFKKVGYFLAEEGVSLDTVIFSSSSLTLEAMEQILGNFLIKSTVKALTTGRVSRQEIERIENDDVLMKSATEFSKTLYSLLNPNNNPNNKK